VINLAVKGYLTIREAHGVYTAYRGKGEKKLPASKDEEKVYGSLFNNRQEVSFSRMNRSVLQSAVSALKRQLILGYEKAYFIQNRWYFLLGLLLTLVVVLGSGMREALDGGNLPLFLFISLWLTGWSVGVAFLLLMVVKSWTEVLKPTRTIGSFAGAVFITLFALPFLGGEIVGIFLLAFQATSPPLAALFLASIAITLVFYQLLKNVTPEGRKRLDEIEGFRTFLEATEKDRLQYLNSPTRTPGLFEKLLPYALALDVEHQWAGQFAHILASAAAEGRSPAWYSGTSAVGLGTASLVASLGDSLSSAVASSSGSSGSGGGGSSGGGGGGGGGGGW
jgi:uncharacterized membrane protein YgcG